MVSLLPLSFFSAYSSNAASVFLLNHISSTPLLNPLLSLTDFFTVPENKSQDPSLAL